MYCDKNDLAEWIKSAQSGDIPDELISVVYKIADGIITKTKHQIDRDDYRQNCVLLFMKLLPRLDAEQNCFSFLTTTFCNVANVACRTAKSHTNLIRKLSGVIPVKPPSAPISKPQAPPQPPPIVNPMWTIEDVAALAGVSRATIYAHINNGVIPRPTVKHKRRKYYTRAEAESFPAIIENHRTSMLASLREVFLARAARARSGRWTEPVRARLANNGDLILLSGE